MLQTLTKEKLSSVLNRGREPREDTVFGALFGSVAYADLVTTGLMLNLLGETFSFDADITRVNVELWPSRMLDGRRVEPDGLIDLEVDGVRRRLIVEAK